MKKKLYSFTILFILALFILSIFTSSGHLTNTINFSTELFIKNIFPSLFPMFIISSLLVEIDLPKVMGSVFKRPMKMLFNTKGEGAFIFFLSMITGFPSSAKYLDDLMEKGQINKRDCEKILMFTFFSNPLFIVNTIGNTFLGDIRYGYFLLSAHIMGNIFVGITFRGFNKNITNDNMKTYNLSYLNNKINECNLFKVLLNSIKSSIDILLNIFGIVTFSLIVISLVFNDPSSFYQNVLVGLIEMTTGLKYLSLGGADITVKLMLSAFFISFGGFSIHFQIMSILTKRKVKYLPFLISRVFHALYSMIFIVILMILFK